MALFNKLGIPITSTALQVTEDPLSLQLQSAVSSSLDKTSRVIRLTRRRRPSLSRSWLTTSMTRPNWNRQWSGKKGTLKKKFFTRTPTIQTLLTFSYIEFMKNWIKDKKPDYMDLAFSSERSIEDELDRTSQSDVYTILVSYIIMFAYIAISLGQVKSFRTLLVRFSRLSLLIPKLKLSKLPFRWIQK